MAPHRSLLRRRHARHGGPVNLTDPRFKYVNANATPTEGVLARWLRMRESDRLLRLQEAKAPHIVQMRKVGK